MSRIPQTFIDDVLNRIDIVEVIDARVPLKKRGNNYMACCPFHNEKTPSFTVSQNKQFYHCFGCGMNGTAISFLMEYDRMEFREAIENLAQQVGMELPQDVQSGPREASRQPLYDALDQANRWYQQQLRQHAPAIEYLKQRGLDGSTAKTFGIGWAPDSWQGVTEQLGNVSAAEQAGLISRGQKDPQKFYDRFRGRIMFPIHDTRGRVIGFGGRVIGNDEPKYLNSPETPAFHKGRELYGLYEARQANRNIERLLIVEGYMDVVMLAQHGVSNAVATLGTATTPEHIEKLFKVCSELVFCFDGDRAGRAAAWRALEHALPSLRDGRQAKFLFLPQGEDPDSMVQQEGSEAFLQRIGRAQAATEYLLEKLANDCDLSHLDGRAKLIETSKPFLAMLPDGALRTLAQQRLAELARTDAQYLQTTLTASAAAHTATQKVRKPDKSLPNRTPMRHAMSLLIQQPVLAQTVTNPQQFAQPALAGGTLFFELLQQAGSASTTAALLERFREHAHSGTLAKLAATSLATENIEQEWQDTLNILLRELRSNSMQELIKKQSAHGLTMEEKNQLRQLIAAQNQS